jgi:dephospho-CoA kinase
MVAEMLAELGADVIDTDAISHALTAAGGAAMAAIERDFGSGYRRADGSLDRAAMRSLVFADAKAKAKLEGILHPMIGAEVRARLKASRAPYVVLVVPLLLETGSYQDVVDRIVVIDCPEEQQIARTMQRSRLTEEAVRSVMAAQISRAERLARADDVISNDADIATLRERVRALHAKYASAAQASEARP